MIMNWRDRIVTDASVHHGQACIRGTRIAVSVILDNLAAGEKPEDIAASYPPLTVDDVRAAIGYAADLAKERVIDIESENRREVQGR
jgi:uncharacterized protein (DUF433 family)